MAKNIAREIGARAQRKKKNLTPAEIMTSRQMHKYLTDMAMVYFRRKRLKISNFRITLYWNSLTGEVACTNGSHIMINCGCELIAGQSNIDDMMSALLGILAHELSHIANTNFGVSTSCVTNLKRGLLWPPPVELKENSFYQDGLVGLTTKLKDPEYREIITRVIMQTSNVLEDGYVEEDNLDGWYGVLSAGLVLVRKTHFASMDPIEVMIQAVDEGDAHEYQLVSNLMLSYAKFGEFKYENKDNLSSDEAKILYRVLPQIDKYLEEKSSVTRQSIIHTVICILWDKIEPYVDWAKEQIEEARKKGEEAKRERETSVDRNMPQGPSAPTGNSGTQSNGEGGQKSGGEGSPTDGEGTTSRQKRKRGKAAIAVMSKAKAGADGESKDEQNGEGKSGADGESKDEQDGEGKSGADGESKDEQDGEGKSGADGESKDEQDGEGKSGADGESKDEQDGEGKSGADGESKDEQDGEGKSGADGESKDEQDGEAKAGADGESGEEKPESQGVIDNAGGEDEASPEGDDALEGKAKNVVHSEEGGRFGEPEEGEALEVEGDGDISQNLDYDDEEMYDGAATDIERMLNSIAEELAETELDRENARDLERLANGIAYGDIHENVRIEVNRITTVDEYLIDRYNSVKPKVDEIVKKTTRSIKEILIDKERGGVQKNLYFGKNMNAKKVYQQDGRLFENKKLPGGHGDVAFGLLLDESGSMSSRDRATSARFTALIFEGICRTLRIPLTVWGHTTAGGRGVDMFLYSDFNKYDNKDKYRMMDISARNSNRDGAALRFVGEMLIKRPEKNKVLFLVCDGQPAASGYHGLAAEEDLKSIKKYLKGKGVHLVVAAIGDDKENIHRIYGSSFMDISNLERLHSILAKKLLSFVKT